MKDGTTAAVAAAAAAAAEKQQLQQEQEGDKRKLEDVGVEGQGVEKDEEKGNMEEEEKEVGNAEKQGEEEEEELKHAALERERHQQQEQEEEQQQEGRVIRQRAEAPPPRRRKATACVSCRDNKTRYDGWNDVCMPVRVCGPMASARDRPLHAHAEANADHVHVLIYPSTPIPFSQVRQQVSVRQVCVSGDRRKWREGGRDGRRRRKDRGHRCRTAFLLYIPSLMGPAFVSHIPPSPSTLTSSPATLHPHSSFTPLIQVLQALFGLPSPTCTPTRA